MSDLAISALAEVNPPARIPSGLNGRDAVSFVPMGDVSESGHWTFKQSRPLRSVTAGFTAFAEGDVLVAKITPCLENGKGAHAVGLENGIGFGSTEFHVLRARPGNSPRFVFHLTQWRTFRRAAEGQMVGSAGQQRVPRAFFDEFLVAEFDADQQATIARILDTLDTAIHETEAIIAKLKAVKQGLLRDLLTRGIDANGELRPPQAEAPHLYKQSPLGWMPKDWDAARFAEVGEVILGRQSAPKYRSGRNMRPYLRVVNVSDDRLDLRDVKAMNFDASDCSRFRLEYGDVLLTEGDLASAYTVGRSAVYRGEIEGCCFQNTLLRFRPTRPQYAEYFHYACCHLRATGRFAVATTATTVHHLSAGRLERDVYLPVPPPNEMEGIAQRLTALDARIDDEADELRKRRDQKAGLTDDLLTGRVRVTPLLAEAERQMECA